MRVCVYIIMCTLCVCVCAGHTEYGVDVLPFTPAFPPSSSSSSASSSVPSCSTADTLCVAIDTTTLNLLSGLHYYFSVRVKNTAGLTSYATRPYLFTSGLPSLGTVLDIDANAYYNYYATVDLEIESGISLHQRDVDVVLSGATPPILAASWGGFAHPHLETWYSVSVGTQPCLADVFPLTAVGGAETSYVYLFPADLLQLTHGERYFTSVVAHNSRGSVNASSDGFVYLDLEGSIGDHLLVYDGHAGTDIDHQSSNDVASAHWEIVSANHTSTPWMNLLSHFKWGLFRVAEEMKSNTSTTPNTSTSVEAVLELRRVGLETSFVSPGLMLEGGQVYVSAVQVCFASTCLPQVFSDGFEVLGLPSNSTTSSISATYTPSTTAASLSDSGVSESGLLSLEWSRPADCDDDEELAYYQWSLGTSEQPGFELLLPWQHIDIATILCTVSVNDTTTDSILSVELEVSAPLSLHTPNTVALRAYNKAGLYFTTGTSLRWSVEGGSGAVDQDSVPRLPIVVYDVPSTAVEELETDGDWREVEHYSTELTDLQYTDSVSSLSASWPDLRYTSYQYSVSTVPTFFPCGSEGSVACGNTVANSITVRDLSLSYGSRYYFCIRAYASDAILPLSDDPPSLLTACSDGVTVDTRPPSRGCVWVLPQSQQAEEGGESLLPSTPANCTDTAESSSSTVYQASTSVVRLAWQPFADVEEEGSAVHSTGVTHYQITIGTYACPDKAWPMFVSRCMSFGSAFSFQSRIK